MISWKTDIRSLFTEMNRECMRHAVKTPIGEFPPEDVSFDLHAYNAVCGKADNILLEVSSGMMPKDDGPRWDIDNVRVFAQWITDGKPHN